MSDGATQFAGYCPKCGAKMYAWRSNGYVMCSGCNYSRRDPTPESFNHNRYTD
jgi:uncharacterized Zn finger protein (UPF0148 family)